MRSIFRLEVERFLCASMFFTRKRTTLLVEWESMVLDGEISWGAAAAVVVSLVAMVALVELFNLVLWWSRLKGWQSFTRFGTRPKKFPAPTHGKGARDFF